MRPSSVSFSAAVPLRIGNDPASAWLGSPFGCIVMNMRIQFCCCAVIVGETGVAASGESAAGSVKEIAGVHTVSVGTNSTTCLWWSTRARILSVFVCSSTSVVGGGRSGPPSGEASLGRREVNREVMYSSIEPSLMSSSRISEEGEALVPSHVGSREAYRSRIWATGSRQHTL